MVEEVSLSLGVGVVALIQVVIDLACGLGHSGELLKGGDEARVGEALGVVGVAHAHGEVGAVIAIELLAQEVLRIGVVCAPAAEGPGVELRRVDLLGNAGDEGLDVHGDKVGAQGLHHLLDDRGLVQGVLVGGLDIVVQLDGEGHLPGQLLHGLLLVLLGLDGVIAALALGQADLLPDVLHIVGAVGEVQQVLHRVGHVLQLLGVDIVGAGPEAGQVQAVVQALPEGLVGDGGVPVDVGRAVLQALAVVEVDGIGVLGGPVLHQVAPELVIGVIVDGVEVGFAQGAGVHIAVEEQGLPHEGVVHHEDGDAVEEGAVLVVVGLVPGQGFGVALDELGDEIGAVVPHVGVLHTLDVVHAQLIHHGLAEGHEGRGHGQGVEVGDVLAAVVDDGIVVGDLDAHGVPEGVVRGREGHGVGLVQFLGVVVVLLGPGDHLGGHGGVLGVVFVVVEDPLQAGQPVLGGALGLLIAVDIHPCHVVPELEGPGQAAVLGAPLGGNGGLKGALGGDLQQAGHAVCEDVLGGLTLVVEDQEGLHLIGGGLVGGEVLDGLRLGPGGLAGLRRGGAGGVGTGGGGGRGLAASAAVVLVSAAAGAQRQHRGQKQGQKPHVLLFHLFSSSIRSTRTSPRPGNGNLGLCALYRDPKEPICRSGGDALCL